MKKEKTKYCINCDKETICKIKEEEVKKIIDNKKIKYIEKNYICTKCNELVYDEEALDYNIKSANTELRKQTSLITSKEIEEIMNKYNIGKKPLSLVLGFGEIQIIRYLTSGNPNKEHSDILKSIKDNPFIFETYLLANKDKISDLAFKKALGKVKQLELANEHSKIYQVGLFILEISEDITNLSLQKILYFINGFSNYFLGNNLFNETPEAWVHGPVYADIYDAFSYYTKENIKFNELIKNDNLDLSDKEKDYIKKITQYFSCYSGSKLRSMSHLTAPWQIARKGMDEEEPSDRIIEKKDIDVYFNNVIKQYKIKEIEDIANYSVALFNETFNQ